MRPRHEHARREAAVVEQRRKCRDPQPASLIVAAETLATRKVFTMDRKDFAAYRVRRGHRHYAVESFREFVWRDSPER